MSKELDKVIQAINELNLDLRAEVVIADLIENGIAKDQIQIYIEGAFKRPYRRDILKAKESTSEKLSSKLEVRLSRNGIYDSLPEGVFHQHAEELTSFSKSYKKRKEEEEDARKFFQPFENELFHQRISIEQKEREMIEKIHSLFDEFLIRFWKIDPSIDKVLMKQLLKLLPSSHLIAGNLPLVSSHLAEILNVPVKYNLGYTSVLSQDNKKSLGDVKLGKNLILGENSPFYRKVTFEIGPVKPENIIKYLKAGEIYKFLDVFYGYFLPFEMEYETIVKSSHETQASEGQFGRLGYTLRI